MGHFISSIPFNEQHADSIVICCSDGRTRQHLTEFMDKYKVDADIFAVPGGPLVLAGGVETFQDGLIAEKRLKFIAESHGTERIIMITHGSLEESCACGMAKKLWPKVSCAERVEKQKGTLLKAAQRVSISLKLPVFCFFANVVDDMVQFEEVNNDGETAL